MNELTMKIESLKAEIERNENTVTKLKEQNKDLAKTIKKLEKVQDEIAGIFTPAADLAEADAETPVCL